MLVWEAAGEATDGQASAALRRRAASVAETASRCVRQIPRRAMDRNGKPPVLLNTTTCPFAFADVAALLPPLCRPDVRLDFKAC